MGKNEGSAAPWPQPEFSAPSATALRRGQVYRTGRPSVKLHGGSEGPAGGRLHSQVLGTQTSVLIRVLKGVFKGAAKAAKKVIGQAKYGPLPWRYL